MNQLILEGKSTIVTGGSSGIGLAIAQTFAREGADVLITGRNPQKLEAAVEEIRAQAVGGKILGYACNVASTEDCTKVFDLVKKEFGKLDVLVNNAGISEHWMIEAIPDEVLDEHIAVNFRGAFIYERAALQMMLPAGKGSVINVSSVNGVRPMCGSAYSATKGAMNTMTVNSAIRCVGTGVRINALCPGFTYTPLSAVTQVPGNTAPIGKSMLPIQETRTVRERQMHVACEAQDQADLALFLASDFSKCINGQIITVDNGAYL